MAFTTEQGATNQGHRRDLRDMLTQVDSKMTPVKASLKKGGELKAVMIEWPVDNMPAINYTGLPDNRDVTDFTDQYEGYNILKVYIHMLRETVKVGKIQQNIVDPAGIGKKRTLEKAIAKAFIVLGRNIEALILSDNETQEGAANLGYETRGLIAWASSTAQAVLPVPAAYLTPAGNIFSGAALSTLTERLFGGLFKSRWDAVGNPMDFRMPMGSTLKEAVNQWSIYTPDVASTTVTRLFDQSVGEKGVKTLQGCVDIIRTDFGSAKLELSSFINISGDPTSTLSKMQGIGFDAAAVELSIGEAPKYNKLEDQGGGPRGYIDTSVALKPGNPKDFIRINPSGA